MQYIPIQFLFIVVAGCVHQCMPEKLKRLSYSSIYILGLHGKPKIFFYKLQKHQILLHALKSRFKKKLMLKLFEHKIIRLFINFH